MSRDDKPDTWMPLVIGDYLKDTTRLTTEQHGAYLLLIMSYWVDGPPLDDDDELAAITGLGVREWKRQRPKIQRFFRIEEGRWRHKRVDEELQRWAERKRLYAERARAGGLAKAAKSNGKSYFKHAASSEKGCLNPAPQPASTEVGAATQPPTLSTESFFSGPKEVRTAFVAKLGEEWCRTYLDRCAWQDIPERALIPATQTAGLRIVREARALLRELGLAVLEKAA